MREYLFKAKTMPNDTIGSSRWIESYRIGNIHPDSVTVGGYQCYPESLGQYTGFLDGSNKKIFEGDIIKWLERREMHDKTYCIGVVIWNDARGIWKVINDKMPAYDFLCNIYVCSTIIGTYFDNPELLEEVKNETE